MNRKPNFDCLTCKGRGNFTSGPCGICNGSGRVRLDVIASVHDLRPAEYDRLISHRAALLALPATGSLDHLEEPVAWLASHGRTVYRITGPLDPRCRDVAAKPSMGDPDVRGEFFHVLRDAVWIPWLEERGWECGGLWGLGASMNAPSGAVYDLSAGPTATAIDAALAREHVDIATLTAEATALMGRVYDRLRKLRASGRSGA